MNWHEYCISAIMEMGGVGGWEMVGKVVGQGERKAE